MKIQNRHRIGGVVWAGASTSAGAGVAVATTANTTATTFTTAFVMALELWARACLF